MAQLEFCDKHNMVAYLVKSESSEGFDEIIDFLTSRHIYYALTENPIIFVSLIEQFWETAILSTTEEGLEAIFMIDGLEKDLQQTKKTYSTALTKLVLRVKKLKYKLKSGKARRKAMIVLSDDEEIAKDSSKQEEEVHEKPSDETEVLVQKDTPTKIIEEHESGKKGEMEISTANIQVSTASPPKVSTDVPYVYTRRSAKDKGKAIMEELATPKKVKKRTQVQLSIDKELARKLEEEERIRFNVEQETRALQEEEERLNLEAARELKRQLDQRQDVPTQPTQSQGID
ncbi:hypothetical protein Tco_0964811 [Tanacetum coccineum]